jgi:hypothetical protein
MSVGVVLPDQSWAIRDHRYERPRYVTVHHTSNIGVHVIPDHSNGRRSVIGYKAFGSSRTEYCGYKGPGLMLRPFSGPIVACVQGCPRCGKTILDPATILSGAGFSVAGVTRNGTPVYGATDGIGQSLDDGLSVPVNEALTLRQIEEFAALVPMCDWRVRLSGPMTDEIYQRQGAEWVLVWQGIDGII